MAVTLPAGKMMVRLSSTLTSGRPGYAKLTFASTISPLAGVPLDVLWTGFGKSMMVWKIATASAAWYAADSGADICPIEETIKMVDSSTLSAPVLAHGTPRRLDRSTHTINGSGLVISMNIYI